MNKKRSIFYLLLMTAVSIVLLVFIELSPMQQKDDLYDLKITAASEMLKYMEVIYNYRIENNIDFIELNDPNKTGLIGAEYTEITTTLGPLEVKRSTTNSDFAALLVELFAETGLKAGDLIAVGASGSFPALAIAVQAAANVMGLDVLSIISIGSSTYGATNIDLTIADIERILAASGEFKSQSIAASTGGEDDILINPMFPDASSIAENIIIKNGLNLIVSESFEDAVLQRYNLYAENSEERKIKAFINIGGAEVNNGNGDAGYKLPAGQVKRLPKVRNSMAGIIHYMFADEVPIINLLNIKELCLNYGIPYDPIPLPLPGTSEIYFQRTSVLYYVLILLVYLSCMAVFVFLHRKKIYEDN